MSNILLASPLPIAGIAASRGAGAGNLVTYDPKEVWLDSAAGSAATIDIDLGSVGWIDTIALVAVYGAAAGATWSITGGSAGYAETVLKASGALRANDAYGQFPSVSHAFWYSVPWLVRYIRITVLQPAGSAPLAIGRALVSRMFMPTWNKEWGSGRGVIDTGKATRLVGGGFASVEGARLAGYSWTLGDLTDEEVETLYALQLDCGETGPLLVVEDPAATQGLRNRIHYGLFTGLRRFERRDVSLTRWELTIEEWI